MKKNIRIVLLGELILFIVIFPSPDSEGEVWLGTDNGLICRGSFDDSFGHIKRTFIYYNQIRMIKRHANEHAF